MKKNWVRWVFAALVIGISSVFLFWQRPSLNQDPSSQRAIMGVTVPGVAHIVHSLILDGACELEISLLGSASGGHHIEMSPEAVSTLHIAKVFLLVGAYYDDWLIPRLRDIPFARLDRMGAFYRGGEEKSHKAEGHTHVRPSGTELKHQHMVDPHFWLDPRQVAKVLDPLIALLKYRFGNRCKAEQLERNKAQLLSTLKKLELHLLSKKTDFGEVRVIATHDAFRYFVRYISDLGIDIDYQAIEIHLAGVRKAAYVYEALESRNPPTVWDVPPYALCRTPRVKDIKTCFRANPLGLWHPKDTDKGYDKFLNKLSRTLLGFSD